MKPFSDVELQNLFRLAHENAGLKRFYETLEAVVTLCRAVEPLVVEVRRLRQAEAMYAQTYASAQQQLREQEGELRVLRARVEGLEARVAAA
jgi:hypothetical protein